METNIERHKNVPSSSWHCNVPGCTCLSVLAVPTTRPKSAVTTALTAEPKFDSAASLPDHEHEFTASCWIDDQPCCAICHECLKCGPPVSEFDAQDETEEFEREERRRIYFGRKRR